MQKIFCFLLLIVICSYSIGQTYKVIGIKDGDTVSLLVDGKPQSVRLAHIDCPEKKQPFGTKAKEMLSRLCFGKYVKLAGGGKADRNKRLIAELILPNGINVNKTMVKNGLAWHYKRYSKDESYAKLEIEAKKKKLGLWKEKNQIAPWNWRKLRKSTPAKSLIF